MKFADADPRWTYEALSESVRKHSRWMEVLGVLLALLGFIALTFVISASFVSAITIGAVLLAAGVTQIAMTFAYWFQRRGGFNLGMILGCLCVVTGLLFLSNPARTLEVITFVMAAYFVASGIVRLILTLSERLPGWGWSLVSSIADIVLGFLIFAWMPAASFVVLGTLLGIQLIFAGVSAFTTGMSVRKFLEPHGEPAIHRPATRFQH